jgi:hypothetical protein
MCGQDIITALVGQTSSSLGLSGPCKVALNLRCCSGNFQGSLVGDHTKTGSDLDDKSQPCKKAR